MSRTCLTEVSSLSTEAMPTGTLVLQGEGETPSMLWDLETGEKTILETDNDNQLLWYFRVSPDRRMLMVRKTTFDRPPSDIPFGRHILSDKLVIMDSKGTSLVERVTNESILGLDWLDNERIAITGPGGIKILNPFTDEEQLITSDWPESWSGTIVRFPPEVWFRDALTYDYEGIFISKGTIPAGWENLFYNGGVVIEPSLSTAIYWGGASETYVILDLETDQIIAQLPVTTAGVNPPKWSPDWQRLVLIYAGNRSRRGQDFYLVDPKDWSYEKVTNYSEDYFEDRGVGISRYKWSPTSDRIAYFIETSEPSDDELNLEIFLELAVFDVERRETTFYCYTVPTYKIVEPIWSPSGEQLIINSYLDFASDSFRPTVVYIDLNLNIAYQMAENLIPMGWMVGYP